MEEKALKKNLMNIFQPEKSKTRTLNWGSVILHAERYRADESLTFLYLSFQECLENLQNTEACDRISCSALPGARMSQTNYILGVKQVEILSGQNFFFLHRELFVFFVWKSLNNNLEKY